MYDIGHVICVHLDEVGKPNQFSWKGTEGGLKNWRSQTAWPTLALIGSKGRPHVATRRGQQRMTEILI